MKRGGVWAAVPVLLSLLAGCGGDPPAAVRKPDLEEGPARLAAGASPKKAGDATLPVLELGSLGAPPAAAEGAEPRPARNLFAFEEDPAIALERERQAREAQEQARAAQRLRDRWQGPPLPPPPPPPPQPPPIPFTFIGYLGPPKARIGVFSLSGGKELILARSGDRIQNRFLVKEVGYESAEIGFEGFTETRRITLTPGS